MSLYSSSETCSGSLRLYYAPERIEQSNNADIEIEEELIAFKFSLIAAYLQVIFVAELQYWKGEGMARRQCGGCIALGDEQLY
jgi:hypothetical protein